MTFSWHGSAGKAFGPRQVYVKENRQDSLNFGSILAGHYTAPPKRLPGLLKNPLRKGVRKQLAMSTRHRRSKRAQIYGVEIQF